MRAGNVRADRLVAWQAMRRKAFQCGPQSRVVDTFGAGFYVFRRRLGNLRRLTRCRPCRLRRLHAEQNTLQAGKCLVRLQLALQATLLITQARRPVSIGDDQQQAALAPRGYPAVRARSRLQLAFDDLLQPVESLRFAEKRSQRLGFAQENQRGACGERAQCHYGSVSRLPGSGW